MHITNADKLIWARTIAGEARGESPRAQLSVAFVPFNRAQLSGRTVAKECLRPWQFSCWNRGDPNRAIIQALGAEALRAFLQHVEAVLAGVPDPTRGATFYHTRSILPSWAEGLAPCARIGRHVFYRDIAPYRLRQGD